MVGGVWIYWCCERFHCLWVGFHTVWDSLVLFINHELCWVTLTILKPLRPVPAQGRGYCTTVHNQKSQIEAGWWCTVLAQWYWWIISNHMSPLRRSIPVHKGSPGPGGNPHSPTSSGLCSLWDPPTAKMGPLPPESSGQRVCWRGIDQGFKIGFNRSQELRSPKRNYESSVENPGHAQRYIDEVSAGRLRLIQLQRVTLHIGVPLAWSQRTTNLVISSWSYEGQCEWGDWPQSDISDLPQSWGHCEVGQGS